MLRDLRSSRRARELPVVVVSAYSRVLPADHLSSVSCVMTKPVQIKVLLAAVQRALEPDETAVQVEALAGPYAMPHG